MTFLSLSSVSSIGYTDIPTREIQSDPNVHYRVNYDDLCGPFYVPENPTHTSRTDKLPTPSICTWQFITQQDMPYMKQNQRNREAIMLLIGNKQLGDVVANASSKCLFLKLMWETFQFARDNNFTEKGVSALLGLIRLTHRFFLSSSWRTAAETHAFFQEGLFIHSTLNPPKSDEVFTLPEGISILQFFWSTYMRHLPLLRFTCLPNYRLVLPLQEQAKVVEEAVSLDPEGREHEEEEERKGNLKRREI